MIKKSRSITYIAFFMLMVLPLASFAADDQTASLNLNPIDFVNNISYLKVRDGVGIGQITQSFIILFLFSTFLERSLEVFVLDFLNKKDVTVRENFARKFSFWVGIFIGLLGVRGLEPSIVLNKDLQGFLFRIIDSILTGTIVSGGTEAVHKVLNSLATSLDNSKAENKAKEAENKAIESEKILKTERVNVEIEEAKVIKVESKLKLAEAEKALKNLE